MYSLSIFGIFGINAFANNCATTVVYWFLTQMYLHFGRWPVQINV